MKIENLFSVRKWIQVFVSLQLAQRLPDDVFLRLKYYAFIGKKLNLDNPKTYNEKIQWLKLYDRRPLYTSMVDKYAVKKYVSERIGQEYIIPELGVWDHPEDIDFDKLPNQFVLKVTHDSGGLVICKDKSKLDIAKAEKKLKNSLKRNYYALHREWPYKDVKRRIIAEAYMEDLKTSELRDYKFFCFNGKVKMMFVATGRQNANDETRFDFFDEKYNHLDLINGHPNADVLPECPKTFDTMKLLAEKLADGIPHVRVDFYEVNGKIYFGEMTFFHWSGFVPFQPESWDYTMGRWIELPTKKQNKL